MSTECPTCKVIFDKRRSNQRYCTPKCQASRPVLEYRRQRYEDEDAEIRKEKRRVWHYKNKFGLSLDEYNELFERQGSACAICQVERKPHQRLFAVDHDHKTGEIFGILCRRCNYRLIAEIRDPNLFDRAAEYLRAGTGRFVPDKYKTPRRRRRRSKQRGK